MTFGQAVKFIRKKHSLTTREFGASIGVSHVAIVRVEKGVNTLTQHHIHEIYRGYGVDPYLLAYGDRMDVSKYRRLRKEFAESRS